MALVEAAAGAAQAAVPLQGALVVGARQAHMVMMMMVMHMMRLQAMTQ